jgi:hypothetical protein
MMFYLELFGIVFNWWVSRQISLTPGKSLVTTGPYENKDSSSIGHMQSQLETVESGRHLP